MIYFWAPRASMELGTQWVHGAWHTVGAWSDGEDTVCGGYMGREGCQEEWTKGDL